MDLAKKFEVVASDKTDTLVAREHLKFHRIGPHRILRAETQPDCVAHNPGLSIRSCSDLPA